MTLTPPSSRDASSIDGVVVTGTPSAGETIVADSATAAHWGAAGGGGVAPSLIGLIVCGAAFPAIGNNSLLNSANDANLSVSSPFLTTVAMDQVCQVAVTAPSDVPDISDNLDCTATLYVTDAAGVNTLTVAGSSSQATPISGVGASIDWTGTSPTIVGVDLTWDDAAAIVSSTAGGVYQSTLILNCAPD